MPSFTHRALSLILIVAALAGQLLLTVNTPLAVAILGAALICALLDGWYFLIPLEQRWWMPAVLGLVGLSMWAEPRGWFFIAWAVIEVGTGIRAGSLIQTYLRARDKEEARRQRLADLGFSPGADDEDSEPDE